MLKRGAGSKSSYSPYSTHRRLKKVEHKDKSKLDLLPNRPNVWLKQLSVLQDHPSTGIVETPSCELSPCGPHSPSLSCPGSPSTMSTKTVSCSSPAPLALQSWVFNKGLGRGVAPQDGPEGSFSEVKDIPSLLRHVARFAQAVEKLKDVVQAEDMLANRRPLAHECLGETLRILRQVITSYPLLNTVEMLTAAGQLISKVKEFQYESKSEADKKDFEKAIETMAVAFSSSISELLMGEADSGTLLSLPPKERSRSLDDVQGELQCHAGALRNADPQECMLRCKEVDVILQRSEGGVESAFTYARAISKYMKDLMSYIEKRMALETEFAKGLQRLCQSFKPNIEQPHMPFSTIYTMALEQDVEQSVGVLSTTSALQSNAFMQPLVQRRQEHDKKCKEIKELWQRERRKLTEAENNLRKAKQTYGARCEEYDRARSNACRAEEEGKSLEKKRRQEEETRNKAEEAEATYRTCIADASTQRQELEDMKVNVLRCLQELMQQCDHTLQDATVSYYKSMHLQTAVLPVHYQSLCESSKLYQLGQHYASYVKHLLMPEEPQVCYEFEPYCAQCPAKVSADSCASFPADATLEETDSSSKPPVTQAKHRHERGHQCHKSWPTVVSDTENVDKDRCQASPTSSAGDVRNMPRTPSSGTMSSTDDVDENDGGVASLEQSMNGIEPEALVAPGPFKNTGLSKAAQTHRLRKLRTPAKCRECDSYVYFQGAECEECYLACHRKCLESLAIQCGHKKLQGRLRLFGRDFLQASRVSSDGIPFIIKKCIKEIERRALKLKGIYRVNGVKTRVEKLCQAFENGKELVELSHASPHDISNVLKLYLRQLPEPVLPFRLYSELMGLAKESMQAEEGEEGQPGRGLPLRDLGGSTEQAVGLLVLRLQELLQNLPAANVATLEYIVSHLSRVAELEVENKMNASNLGIVFGPTLMRPRPTGGTVSLSSLVDYPYQARIVEMLIVFYQNIFQSLPASSSKDVTSDQLSQAPGSQSDEADVDEEHSTPGKQTVCDSCDSDGEHAGTPPASIAARQEGQRSSAESSLGAHFSD